jgi:sterol desaturase/sphingolipid hydroxylase (fatty acid hydroxylase superfamily)
VAFVVVDFTQWMIHILMHRIPWFWEFHKVHHSIEELDWLGSLKFHWMEIVIYKVLQYPILALLGLDYQVLFILAIISTVIGHFNHSNFRLNLGPLKYFLNGPEMHEWHHVHPDAGPLNKNFGINLSLWDWAFGAAYLPKSKASPSLLGFKGIKSFPKGIVSQELWPLSLWFGKLK